jgi:hypothetical protein
VAIPESSEMTFCRDRTFASSLSLKIASKIVGLAGDLTKRSTFCEMRLERPEAIQCVLAFATSYDASSSPVAIAIENRSDLR